jgi:glycosyltransferase involved in cell wall biosynthesis
MHVVQVSFHYDRDRRTPDALLEAWQSLTDVAAAVARSGVELTVVQAAHRTETIQRDGLTFRFVAERGRRGGRALPGGMRIPTLPRNLLHTVASSGPDVVHVHGFGFPVQTRALAARLPAVPILVQDHANRPPSRWRRPLYRRGLSAVSATAFTARDQADAFVAAGLIGANLPVFEILEASSRFSPGEQRTARGQTGLSGNPGLLWVGRLSEPKDPFTVLDAFAQAARELDDAQLWCCFESGTFTARVEDRVAADPVLRDRVHLVGHVSHEEIEHFMRAADLFVLASTSEGSGYAAIEALACGLTPLLSDISSFRKMTRNGSVGALFPNGDADALARLFVESSKTSGDDARVRARAHFEQFLSYDVIGRDLHEAYAALTRGS